MDWTQARILAPPADYPEQHPLSGDDAMVIALVCRALPPRQRHWGMVVGAEPSSWCGLFSR
jgi:hypothetical protein